MKRTPLKRGTAIKRAGRIKPKKRTASEFSRIYGSKARVAWVKAQPCMVVGCNLAPCENAHIESGGMGRKADYTKIIPLCRDHHWQSHNYGWDVLQGLGTKEVRDWAASVTQQRWERYAEGE